MDGKGQYNKILMIPKLYTEYNKVLPEFSGTWQLLRSLYEIIKPRRLAKR